MGEEWLNLFSEYAGGGHELILVGRAGRVLKRVRHYPWFVATGGHVYGREVVGVETLEGVFMGVDPSTYTYRPVGRPLKVKVVEKSKVPLVAKAWHGLGGGKRAGMYNITYEVRAAYDLQKEGWGLLGFRTPLAFLPNREMVRRFEESVDVIGSLKVMAVDIEVYSRRGGFPVKGDPLLSITYSTFRLDEDIFGREWPEENVRYLLNDEVDDPTSSRRLIRRFIDVLRREQPDIIVGYNTSEFDFPYMAAHPASILLHPHYVGVDDLFFNHIDLLTVRDSLGSSLNVRSQTARSLLDVALEVVNDIKSTYDIGWLLDSEYIRAETAIDHAKLRWYFDRGDRLFFHYIVADVYLTSIIARIWLYPLLMLSILTGIPLSVLQMLNTGQIAEYISTEVSARLGLYPELKERSKKYSRVTEAVSDELRRVEDWWVFEQGKVYVKDYGLYGGDGYKIVELDFAQLYPSDMVVNTSDPTSIYIVDGFKYSSRTGRVRRVKPTLTDTGLRIVRERSSWALLKRVKEEEDVGERKRRKRRQVELEVYKVVPGYGPLSWFVYKLFQARKETKKLKKKAKELGRPELKAADQAVKILNNSFYGAMSKSRGNYVNELVAASIFWRTQKMLYEVVRAIEGVISEEMGTQLQVLYGDTDSTYVLVPEGVDEKELARKVNEWVQERYGSMYEMELEGVYKWMLIPKQKDVNSPSAKTYLCLDTNMEVRKVKGEFFKLEAPLALKERIQEFYLDVIRERPRTMDEVERVIERYLRDAPPYKLFIKGSVSSFVRDDDPARFKNFNKPFHFAALVSLCEMRGPGVSVEEEKEVQRLGGRARRVRCRINPRKVQKTQRAVIVHYLPHPSGKSTAFLLYMGEDGESVRAYDVEVEKWTVLYEGRSERDRRDTEVLLTYTVTERSVGKGVLLHLVLRRIRRKTTMTVYKKLVQALHKGVGGGVGRAGAGGVSGSGGSGVMGLLEG